MIPKGKFDLRVSFQKMIYRIIGSGSHIGNSRLTEGVFVYNPSLFKSNFPKYKRKLINSIIVF